MTEDTITIERIKTLATLTLVAGLRLEDIRKGSLNGEITTDEAAAEINEIIDNLNSANQ